MKLAERIFKRNDYQLTSPFGYRTNPLTGAPNEFHDGVDYGTKRENWNQYAIEEGTVTACGTDSSGANYVWVEYPRIGVKLLHYHLAEIKVLKGQSVNENTIIGTTGMTGNATGIHLHLGMKFTDSNTYVNAEEYDYRPYVNIAPVERDESKHQIEVTIDNLNARKSPYGERYGVFMPKGYYDVLEETVNNDVRWARVGTDLWCALLDDCYNEFLPISIEEYKSLYLEEHAKNRALNAKLEAIRKVLEEQTNGQ